MKKEPSYHDLLERMQIIIEHSNELFYLHDTNHILSYVSPTSKKILGYNPEEMMIDWTTFATDNPINKKGYESTERAIRTGERQPPYLMELRKQDGSHALLEVDESPVTDNSGSVVAIVGALRNVTEKIRAEEALRAERDKARLYLDISSVIFVALDKNGLVRLVNKKGCQVLGLTKEEIIGKNWFDHCIPERIKNETRTVFNQMMSGESAFSEYFENPIQSSDGKEHIIAWHNTHIQDKNGSIAGTLSSGEDITERKLAEKALQESEAKYHQLFHYAPAGIYEFDMQERRFISVNDVMCEYTGYSEAEFMELDVIDLLSEDSLAILGALLEKAAAGDSNPDPVEYRIKGKNQREFWVVIHSRFSYDTHGNPWKVTGVAHDITERRQAEEENKKLENKLMQAQKMEAIGTLSGGIAHDFNNLMTGILGNTSLMLFDLDENHIHYERLKQIEQLVKRGADLTRQLLGLSRQGKLEALPTNLNDLIHESVEIYGRTKKDIQIHTKLQDDIWTINVDRGQIEQVLLNLFINAWQAMPQGGNLFIETHNCFLNTEETKANNISAGQYVKTVITDTGIGMDKATQQKVFDPFFTTKEMERGTGLGLASVYGIVQNHEGMIHVHSVTDRGTTFTFYLPTSDKKVVKQQESTPSVLTGQGTILLVDDEKMVAETAKKMLEKLGYHVTAVASGKEALSAYSRRPNSFDMVILDMVMPVMGGYQTFEQLKQIDDHVKVLLSSGFSINKQVKNLLSLGCKGFIQKPFTVHELSQKVGAALA